MSGLPTNSLEFSMSELKKGDIIEDPDGTKWYVHGIVTSNGKPKPMKIRVGSIAAKMLGYESAEQTSGG
jgi:hypothetical protein